MWNVKKEGDFSLTHIPVLQICKIKTDAMFQLLRIKPSLVQAHKNTEGDFLILDTCV